MKWLDSRIETPNAMGIPVIYPSFVKEFSEGVPGGPVAGLVDCWAPDLRNDPVLDYQQGRLHFAAAQRTAEANGCSAFLGHVLNAMAVREAFGAIEYGFADAMIDRAMVGAGPAFADSLHDSKIAPEVVLAHRETAWEFIRVCQDVKARGLLSHEVERIILKMDGAWDAVLLTAVAGTAYNGARS